MAKRLKPKGRADHQGDLRSRTAPASSAPVSGSKALNRSAAATSASSAVTSASPPADAVSAFDRAMQLLQRHQYAEAAGAFRGLIDGFPAERGLLDRARVYLDHCERELRRRPPSPTTVEERLTAATAALNVGDDRRAASLAESVLAEEPRQDLALYLLAAIAARRDATDAALVYLGEAIAVSPEARAQARLDADFQSLRDDERFRQLVDTSDLQGPGGRRTRRGRAER